MKTQLLLLLTFLSFTVFAQKNIEVNEVNASFDNGKHNALKVTIYGSDQKNVEKKWKSLMKDFNAKVNVKKTIFADNATIKELSDNTVDVYATSETTKDNDVILYVAFDLGGSYLSSSEHGGNKYNVAKKIVYKFAVDATKDALKNKIDDAKKILSTKQKEQNNLEKENKKLNNDIEDYNNKIKKAKDEISDNEKKQADKKKEIEEQQSLVNSLEEKEKSVK